MSLSTVINIHLIGDGEKRVDVHEDRIVYDWLSMKSSIVLRIGSNWW